jgi:hypothetical protein
MSCNDPYLEALRSLGYSVIRLPRADVAPLQLLAKRGDTLDRIGELATVILPGDSVPLPSIKKDTPAANLSGMRSGELSLGVGLSLLGTVIGAMGGSKLGLDLKYKNAKSVTFEFQGVLEDRADVGALDQYLTDADVSPFSTHVARLLEADRIYVTTATLKTRKLAVEAKGSKSTGFDVSIPEIKGVVGGNVKVGPAAATASKVTFEGSLPLVFAFQAARLVYEKGRYTRFELTDHASAFEKAPELLSEGSFVRLFDV